MLVLSAGAVCVLLPGLQWLGMGLIGFAKLQKFWLADVFLLLLWVGFIAWVALDGTIYVPLAVACFSAVLLWIFAQRYNWNQFLWLTGFGALVCLGLLNLLHTEKSTLALPMIDGLSELVGGLELRKLHLLLCTYAVINTLLAVMLARALQAKVTQPGAFTQECRFFRLNGGYWVLWALLLAMSSVVASENGLLLVSLPLIWAAGVAIAGLPFRKELASLLALIYLGACGLTWLVGVTSVIPYSLGIGLVVFPLVLDRVIDWRAIALMKSLRSLSGSRA